MVYKCNKIWEVHPQVTITSLFPPPVSYLYLACYGFKGHTVHCLERCPPAEFY